MEQDLISPKYIQLKSILIEQIKTGALGPGTKMPTHRDLMRKYGLSCSTVSRALLDLVYEGLIYRVPGKGSFIADSNVIEKFKRIQMLDVKDC